MAYTTKTIIRDCHIQSRIATRVKVSAATARPDDIPEELKAGLAIASIIRPFSITGVTTMIKPEIKLLLYSLNLLKGNECIIVCLLYTSDAADEEDSVDLGGRRIIKKKKKKKETNK